MGKRGGSKDNKKSLKKDKTRFIDDAITIHGGTHGGGGRVLKSSSKADTPGKHYFLAYRSGYHEYFAFEILNAIGLATPKMRFIEKTEQTSNTLAVITKAIDNYIPFAAYTNLWSGSSLLKTTPEIQAIQERYRFHSDPQVIRDVINKQDYKISGNLFAADIGAYLLQDTDFIGEGTNYGLVKEGSHFQAYFIDKDFASFQKMGHYKDLSELIFRKAVYFFKSHPHLTDQKLSVISSLNKLIIPGENNTPSELENIFYNDRTASLYKSHLPKIAHQKVVTAVSMMGSEFLITYENKTINKLLNFSENVSFGAIQDSIQLALKEQLKIQPPEQPLNTAEQVENYLNEMNNTAANIIKGVINSNKEYATLTVSSMFSDLMGKDLLEDKTEYTLKPAAGFLIKPSFTFTKTMPIADFFINQYQLFYDFPAKGYIATKDPIPNNVPFYPGAILENVRSNAELIINNALAKDKNALQEFDEREAIRDSIAKKVIALGQEHFETHTPYHDILIDRIKEDLRADYYSNLFEKNNQISDNDTGNQNLINKLYADNRMEIEVNRNKIKEDLKAYITRINPNPQESIDFTKGFGFFVSTQSMNRRANYYLALKLLKQLDSAQSVDVIFDDQNIKTLRQEFFDRAGIPAKIISLNCVGWGINSLQLKTIIEDAQQNYKEVADRLNTIPQAHHRR